MEDRKIRVAITHGDTNGVGYELIFKTFAEPEMLELCTPIIYGSPKVAAYHRKALDLQANFSIVNSAEEVRDGRINLLTAVEEEVKAELGMPTPESGDAALKALDTAMTDYREGLFDVLVTAPVNRDNMKVNGFPFSGHTRYIEASVGEGQKALTVYVNDHLRLAFATAGMPLKSVAQALNKDDLVGKVKLLYKTVRRDFNISNPRIAVLALNPASAGKAAVEEERVIAPAIEELAKSGVEAFGPYAADEFFGNGDFEHFDAVLAMYYDQAMPAFKSLSVEHENVFTAGLPLIRTAACEGVDYELTGRGVTDESSFRHAVYLAIDTFRYRENYDLPLGDPLKKLYHERRDESEKVRFAIPKKHSGQPFQPRRAEGQPKLEVPKKE